MTPTGVIRVMQYNQALADGILRTGVSLKILHETPAVATANGQWGLGQVQTHRLLDLVIPKAQGVRSRGRYAVPVWSTLAGSASTASERHERGWHCSAPLASRISAERSPLLVGKLGESARILCAWQHRRAMNRSFRYWYVRLREGKVRVHTTKAYRFPRAGCWMRTVNRQRIRACCITILVGPFNLSRIAGVQGVRVQGYCWTCSPADIRLTVQSSEIGARSANAVVFALFDPAQFGIEHFCQETGDLAANVPVVAAGDTGNDHHATRRPGTPDAGRTTT
jgi:hypothetical protein